MFSKEVVEFQAKGLDVIQAETKAMEKAVDDLRKANRRLKQEMRDGSWEKQSRSYAAAQRELRQVRAETERLAKAQRMASLRGQYGRLGGTAAYYGGRMQQVAGGIGGGFSGMVGLAGSVGVPLGVGALASRGFSGTAAMSKLNMEIDRLSRHIATDLLPLLEGFSRNLSRINQARDATRAGRGTFGDRVLSSSLNVQNILGAFGANMLIRRTGGYAMNAGRLANVGRAGFGFAARSPGPTAAIGGGLYSINEGLTERSRERRMQELSERQSNGNRIRFAANFTPEEYQQVKGIISQAENIKDPDQRKRAIERYIETTRAKQEALGKRIDDKSIFGKMFNSSDEREQYNRLGLRLNAAQRMKLSPGSIGEPTGMKIVEGAGERRSGAALYEELASSVAQMSGNNSKGTTTADSVVDALNAVHSTLQSLLNPLQSIANAVGS